MAVPAVAIESNDIWGGAGSGGGGGGGPRRCDPVGGASAVDGATAAATATTAAGLAIGRAPSPEVNNRFSVCIIL